MSQPAARRVRVTGRVQGVGFRDWTRRTARALDLTGWVRNRSDGSVEAHVEGAGAALDDMLSRLREGPRHARVESVEAQDAAAEGGVGFEIRR